MTKIVSVHGFADLGEPATAKQISEQLHNSDDTAYVFYSHPSVYVAYHVSLGATAKVACSDWLTGINEALEAQRKNRRKVRLLCLQDAIAHPDALTEKASLDANEVLNHSVDIEPLTLMTGHQLVLQNADIMEIIERLDANTLHLSNEAYQVEVDAEAVLNQYKQTQKKLEEEVARASSKNKDLEEKVARASGTREQLEAAKDENELMLLQLQQVQEELEQVFIAKKETEKNLEELSKLEASNSAYKQRNTELEAENKQLVERVQQLNQKNEEEVARASGTREQLQAAKDENELLLLQLQQVQEELEQVFIAKKETEKNLEGRNELEASNSAYKQRNTELEAENKQLMEHIQQLNKKNGQEVRDSGTTKQLQEAKEENELLLLQLQQVQEELEAYFIKYQDSEKQRAKQQQLLAGEKRLNHGGDVEHQDTTGGLRKQSTTAERASHIYKQEPKRVQAEQSGDVSQLLAKKEAEIARLNQQLLKLELQSLSNDFNKSKKPSDNALPKQADPLVAEREEFTAKPQVADTEAKQPTKRRLSSRIKNRLKLGKRKGSDKNAWIKEQVAQLEGSTYFDGAWYLQQYPDLQEAGVNPAEHYLRFGGFESRDPSPKFNSAFYLEQNTDVAQEGINPLLHFLLYGKAEGRLPKPQSKSSVNSGVTG